MTLAASTLAFGFGGRALGRVSELTLSPGEAVCVLGPNGAGKTTLLRTLLGLLPPLEGSITLDGAPLAVLARAEVARRMAFVPQAAPMVFEFTLLEMVEMGRVAHLGAFASPSRRDTALAHEALERLGLAALADRTFGAVSGGERQLALVARALATGAPCLVLDEPAAHLDFANQGRLMEELARLRAAGVAILLSSHDPDHAFRLGGQALLLHRGETAAFGDVDAVATQRALSRLYGVEVTLRRATA